MTVTDSQKKKKNPENGKEVSAEESCQQYFQDIERLDEP